MIVIMLMLTVLRRGRGEIIGGGSGAWEGDWGCT